MAIAFLKLILLKIINAATIFDYIEIYGINYRISNKLKIKNDVTLNN